MVAVLDAGEDDAAHPLTKVPLYFWNLQNTDADWAYRTVPQKYACKGLENNVSSGSCTAGLGPGFGVLCSWPSAAHARCFAPIH